MPCLQLFLVRNMLRASMLAMLSVRQRSAGLPVLQLRLYSSALSGNRAPIENVMRNNNPMLHQEGCNTGATEAAFELRVPGRYMYRDNCLDCIT